MAFRLYYRCGCNKWITRFIPAPEYKGIFSVHEDGSTCSSMHEGDCPTLDIMKKQCELTRLYYARHAYQRDLAHAKVRLLNHYNLSHLDY